MATLTLKKKPALPDVVGTFAVMRQSENTKSMRFTRYHATKEVAATEAARLREDRPDQTFLVVQVLECLRP